MPKIKFLDSVKNKKKSLVLTHTEEDIVLNLPKDSGTLVTDKVAEQKVREHNPNSTQNVTFIQKPDITENNGGVTASNWDEYFKIASYRPSAGFLGKHTGTEWVAYSDSNLSSLVDRSVDNVMHKEKWKPNTNLPNLNLYVRYRFVSNYIYSPWSDSIHVVTAAGGILPFEVSVEENTLSPICSVSTFGVYGDATGSNHVSTSWVVYEANGDNLGNKVLESIKDTTNKMIYKIGVGKLEADKEYYLQVTLHTDSTKYPNSKIYTKKFITNSAYINRPVLEYKATNDSRHIIKASDFSSSDSSQSLVSAIWKLYDADNNTLLNSATNTSKEYDITLFVTSKKKYYVTLVYKSSLLVSKEGKCVFVVKGSKADPITATFETSADKLPILKLSKFYVPGETDEVKLMVYKSNHKDFSFEGGHGWFNGKYNVPMEHNITRDEYRTLLDLEKEWDNSPLKFKAYIIGNKYNSDMFEATFTPDISLNYKVVKYGESWEDFKIQIVKDDSLNPGNPTPGWIGFESVSIYGDKINTPINPTISYHTEHTPIIPIPNNGYEYNKDYHFTFKIRNSIGIRTIEYTTKMEGGTITDPDMTIEAKHAYGNYVNMKVKGTEYGYSRPINSTNGLKEIKLTIQDTSDNNKVVYEQIQTVADKGPAVYNFDINYDKDHLDKSLKHNTKYLVSIEYKNVLGERSKRVSKEFTTLVREEIVLPNFEITTKPSVQYLPYPNHTKFYISSLEVKTSLTAAKIFSDNSIDKIVFRVKDENGVLIGENVVTTDDFQANRNSIKPNDFTNIVNCEYIVYDWEKIVQDQWQATQTIYQNPYFELGKVYIIEVELIRETVSKVVSDLVIFAPSYYGHYLSTNYVKATSIDNLSLRSEREIMIAIDNPNITSGTILTNQQAADILSKEFVFKTSNVHLDSMALTLGKDVVSRWPIERFYITIVTNFRDPSKSKIIVNTIDNPRDDPKFLDGHNETLPYYSSWYHKPIPPAETSTTLTYNDVEPKIYVNNVNGKWYVVFKCIIFPRNVERNPAFIYPFYPGQQFGYLQLEFNYQYKDTPTFITRRATTSTLSSSFHSLSMDFFNVPLHPTKRRNTIAPDYTTGFITTDKYVEREIGLSKVRSYKYDVLKFPREEHDNSFRTGEKRKYPVPYLEYLPVDGCRLIAIIWGKYLIYNSHTNLAPEDNLIVQPNPKNGLHFKIYKVDANGDETELPDAISAFSGGLINVEKYSLVSEYNDFGAWTKPVNKRKVLEHGQLYKVKMWFVPYNNEMFGRLFYTEKHFIGYDSTQGDVNGPVDQKPMLSRASDRYNCIMVGDLTKDEHVFRSANHTLCGIRLMDAEPINTQNGLQGADSDPTTLTETLMFSGDSEITKRYIPCLFGHDDINNVEPATGGSNSTVTFEFKNTLESISCIWTDTAGNNHYYSRNLDTAANTINSDFRLKNPTGININTPESVTPRLLSYTLGLSNRYTRRDPLFTLQDNSYISKMAFNNMYAYRDINLTTFYICPTYNKDQMYSDYFPMITPISKTGASEVMNGSKTTDIGNIVLSIPKKSDLYKPGYILPANVVSASDFNIGEEHKITVTNAYGKNPYTLTKQVRDWIKDTVEDGLPLIQDEHIKFTDIKNLPQEDIDKSKSGFPLNPNEDKYVYKTLHIYKFCNTANIDIYGSDMFNMVSPLLRNLEGFNYSDVGLTKPGMIASVLKTDSLTTIAAFYRYGIENSKWVPAEVGFTNNNYMWPIYKKVENSNVIYDITLPTQGNPLRSIYRDIKFKSYVGNTVGTIETSNFYSALTYDMIAIVFKYNRFRLYNIIYYRVDRTTGEMSYHKEDQNIVFNQETSFGSGLDLPLMSNKAMCFLHTVKPNGDVIRHPEVPSRVPSTPGDIADKMHYVVEEEQIEDMYVRFDSYLFIEQIDDIVKCEVQNAETGTNWVTLTSGATTENNKGYTYGTGYSIFYNRRGSYQMPNIHYSPNAKVRLTDIDGQVSIYDVKLGNFKRMFPGGKEYEAIVTSEFSLNYKLIKIGDTWDDFTFQVVKDDSLNPGKPTPNWVTISKIVVSGDRIAAPLESTTDKVKIPNNGYEYMQDYNFTVQVYTNAGTKTFNTIVRLDKGVIGTPDMTITTKHGRDAYINAKVVGSGYTYNMPINNTNDIKSIELTVYELRSDGAADHKVLDITQTVSGMSIPNVYTFNLNYNKDNLSQSLKHNTNYQFNMVYENIKGEKSLIGIKKIKTPEREIIKPIKPEIHSFYIRVSNERDKNNKTIGTIDEYEVSIRNGYNIKKAFANGEIDKLNYTIKALDGTVVNNKDYTIEDYRAGLQKITDPSTSLKELSPSYLSYDFDNYISSLNRDFSAYQKPFKSGNVYECVVTTYYEDQKSSSTTYQLVRTGFADQFDSTLTKNMIDNLPLRLEYQYKTEIPNPGVASGSTIDISRLQELIRYCPAQDDPNLKLEEFTFRAGIYGDIDTFGLYIRTNFVDPSRNAAWVRAERIKDSDKYRTYGQGDKGSERVELSYADFKPIVKVIYENSKWYVILLYKGISRTLERTPNFLFPYGAGTYNDVFKIEKIIYKHYGINVTFGSTYEGMGNQDGNGSVTEWAWEIRPFNAGLYSDPKYPLVTTEEYSKNQIPLSGVSSANYNITLCTHASSVRSISRSGPKCIVSYPYSTLEYLPINGCCLLMYIGTSYLTSAKVAEADNFLVQPHDKTGVHFQIYELKADGSEVLVEGAETAFSVGVYNGTGDKEYLGKWTKPVNRRKVLDHGKLYKLKFHFVPYNNATYASHFYVEKVFVGY